ncbi:undecaprenyl-phosphate glucose phosphotransferase [Nitrospirillum sp. BR 11164]|uniref:undecaprenyl-phosphate glucose phosphotransferase n=1 Tax=Nitrospirillum sp. BR 11164 TaxID=3104324 RepID=UPI002AFE835B|nr:undecaprenyl-phosphate glucose phosphotransferase [Nitrospirillum sp. BR 11164]MEA1652693.1 undecaprenyl-phosphate glucose phosphotransferase [Nitrospirillum sp. BR 11164]
MPPALSEALSTPLVTLRETQAVAVPAEGTQRLRGGRPLAPQVITGTVAAVDALAILATGLAASALADGTVARPLFGLVLIIGLALGMYALRWTGARQLNRLCKPADGLLPLALAWAATAGSLVALLYLLGAFDPPMTSWLAIWSLLALGALVVGRLATCLTVNSCQRAGRLTQAVAIVGTGPEGQRLLRRYRANPRDDRHVVGVYDDNRASHARFCVGYPIRGGLDDLLTEIREGRVDRVILAMPLSDQNHALAAALAKLSLAPVDVGISLDQVDIHRQAGGWREGAGDEPPVLDLLSHPLTGWRAIAKTVEDRVLAAIILVMISPIMLAIAVAIKLESKGPVFFKQKRHGYNNQLIEVYKFRSMYHHMADANAEKLAQRNDPRITRLGRILRRTSLDELPQFINVLRGEMSIVGPRPHAQSAKAGGLLYRDAVAQYDSRHRMKPGITGLAQVSGWRGETSTVEHIVKRVEHDLRYIETWTVLGDLKIIARTITSSIFTKNAY